MYTIPSENFIRFAGETRAMEVFLILTLIHNSIEFHSIILLEKLLQK